MFLKLFFMRLVLLTVGTSLFFLGACRKNRESLASLPYEQPVQPAHFPPAHYANGLNPYTLRGFELGRKLFYDPLLSKDSSVSCASCHRQTHAFADAGNTFSTGLQGARTTRHTPALFNLAWHTSFMWDGGVNHLEVVSLSPIIHPGEMGETLTRVVEKLKRHPVYPQLFREAFGTAPLTDQQLFWALALYMRNLVSYRSRYDAFVNGKGTLNKQELQGLKIFRTYCAACHPEPLFMDNRYHNNGLDSSFSDPGRYRITQNPEDQGKFKTPSLRNLAFSAPYMHDGRFEDLDAVLRHYTRPFRRSESLAPEMKKYPGGFPLSEEDVAALKAFLMTLTDSLFILDTHLGAP